jgi:hypothetical protein
MIGLRSADSSRNQLVQNAFFKDINNERRKLK